MKRRQITINERHTVYERASGVCQICGQNITYEEMTVDHITPLYHGGTNQLSNFQCACRSCNQIKQNFQPNDFYEKIVEIFWYQTKIRCGKDFMEKMNKFLSDLLV